MDCVRLIKLYFWFWRQICQQRSFGDDLSNRILQYHARYFRIASLYSEAVRDFSRPF